MCSAVEDEVIEIGGYSKRCTPKVKSERKYEGKQHGSTVKTEQTPSIT
jgi:hypothetical protein